MYPHELVSPLPIKEAFDLITFIWSITFDLVPDKTLLSTHSGNGQINIGNSQMALIAGLPTPTGIKGRLI